MITPGETMFIWEEALKNPEIMIKHKDDLKGVEIFLPPWHAIFSRYPYLYREFSDRFDEMDGVSVTFALLADPTLTSDLKDHLHKMSGEDVAAATLRKGPTLILGLKDHLHKLGDLGIAWLEDHRLHPELSLYLKYKDDPDKIEAAYYVTFPHELDNLNKEEKRKMGKKIIEFLKEEKA